MRSCAAFIAALAVASCATPDRSPPEMHPLVALITGSEASMVRFEVAARQCGAQVFSVDRGREPRWIGIGRGLGAPAGDTRIECAMRWIVDHPEESLSFVGNESR